MFFINIFYFAIRKFPDIIIVLIALGFMASSIFHDHYIEKIKSELVREADAICRIVLEEYMDDAKRPVAKEKLFAIVRQYEALLQLCFIDPSLGIRSFYDEKNASKWQASEEFDVETLAKNIVSQTNFEYGYAYDLLDGYTTVRTLTVTCPISTAENITVGALMLHYDMDGIYASLNKLYIDVFAAVAGAVLITIPIAFIISKYITKPVSQINDAVTAFSRGNYDSRVKVGRMDELGELGISFNDMADKVSELEKMRRDFVANVSHELRTPITVLRGYSESLADGVVSGKQQEQEYYQRMVQECQGMERLVGDLFILSKMQNPEFQIEKEPVSLIQIFSDVVRHGHVLGRDKKIQFQVEMPENEPCLILGDYDRLRQMFLIIVDNAVKFSDENGVIEISMERQQEKDWVRLWIQIRDYGIGISEEQLPYIFEKFYTSKLRQNQNGTGLGLMIAKQIALRHGGDISVESQPGEGTTFYFSFTE